MKHLLLTLVLVLMGSQISAQFSRETLAVEMMDRWRYADAYPIWADLAQESFASDSTRWDWVRLASESSFISLQKKYLIEYISKILLLFQLFGMLHQTHLLLCCNLYL